MIIVSSIIFERLDFYVVWQINSGSFWLGLYKFWNVLYQFLGTGTSYKTNIGWDQLLKCLGFSLYSQLFYPKSSFKYLSKFFFRGMLFLKLYTPIKFRMEKLDHLFMINYRLKDLIQRFYAREMKKRKTMYW